MSRSILGFGALIKAVFITCCLGLDTIIMFIRLIETTELLNYFVNSKMTAAALPWIAAALGTVLGFDHRAKYFLSFAAILCCSIESDRSLYYSSFGLLWCSIRQWILPELSVNDKRAVSSSIVKII